jgi:uncharacterized protein
MRNLAPGTPVRVDHRKWDGAQHWQTSTVILGHDLFGTWVGAPSGTAVDKPGVEYVLDVSQVKLIPQRSAWTTTFYDRPVSADPDPDKVQVYVDISSVPAWHLEEDPVRVSLVDLDLDVVRRGELTYIDDEDEFAEHQIRYGYPPELIERCEHAATEVLQQVTDRAGPFAPAVARNWLAVLHDLCR